MEYEFAILYKSGEREVGVTYAESLEAAIKNIVDYDEIDEIDCINFAYTMRYSAFFENEDIAKMFD